jgi:hypothetical protein
MQNTFNLQGQQIACIDIRQFREQYNVPQFGIALIEPKDFEGLARLDESGNALKRLRQTIIDAIPESLVYTDLPDFIRRLSALFRIKLYEINDSIGLKPVEMDFASAGFEDVCQAFGYALIQAKAAGSRPPDFDVIYRQWLEESVRISTAEHVYQHGETQWKIHALSNAYGRIGLIIHMPEATVCVVDSAYTCPAEAFMAALLKQVTSVIQNALPQNR